MEITPIGWILIPSSIYFIAFNPRFIYIAMIFFIPFSATAVINIEIGLGVGDFGLLAYHFFGILFILRSAPEVIPNKRSIVAPPFVYLVIFTVIVILSLIMPFIIDGRISTYSYTSNKFIPHVFRAHNITQTIYLLFGVVISLLIVIENNTPERITTSFKTYIASGIFISIWGWVQLLCYRLNITYPDYLFNTSKSLSARNFSGILEDLDTKRISSVAVEPSIFAQVLLTIIPLLLFMILMDRKIFSPFLDRLALAVMSLILLLSTSAVATIGFGVMLLIFLLFLSLIRALTFRRIRMLSVLFIGMIILYGLRHSGMAYLNDYVVSKLSTGSGIERLSMFKQAWQHFADYPIMGIGWRSADSSDLIVGLLANVGIIGFSAFAFYILHIVKRLLQMAGWRNQHDVSPSSPVIIVWAGGLIISLAMLLFANSITGFAYVFGHLWFILGMTMAVPIVFSKERQNNASQVSLSQTYGVRST